MSLAFGCVESIGSSREKCWADRYSVNVRQRVHGGARQGAAVETHCLEQLREEEDE